MAIIETNILKRIQLACSALRCKLLRNNTGLFITLDGKRKTHAGLGIGTSDLIGWTRIKVTPGIVGCHIAVFTAIEVKRKGGKKGAEQKDFINAIISDGGYAGFATSADEAKMLLQKGFPPQLPPLQV